MRFAFSTSSKSVSWSNSNSLRLPYLRTFLTILVLTPHTHDQICLAALIRRTTSMTARTTTTPEIASGGIAGIAFSAAAMDIGFALEESRKHFNHSPSQGLRYLKDPHFLFISSKDKYDVVSLGIGSSTYSINYKRVYTFEFLAYPLWPSSRLSRSNRPRRLILCIYSAHMHPPSCALAVNSAPISTFLFSHDLTVKRRVLVTLVVS